MTGIHAIARDDVQLNIQNNAFEDLTENIQIGWMMIPGCNAGLETYEFHGSIYIGYNYLFNGMHYGKLMNIVKANPFSAEYWVGGDMTDPGIVDGWKYSSGITTVNEPFTSVLTLIGNENPAYDSTGSMNSTSNWGYYATDKDALQLEVLKTIETVEPYDGRDDDDNDTTWDVIDLLKCMRYSWFLPHKMVIERISDDGNPAERYDDRPENVNLPQFF